jgi:hypothetical protein
MDEKEAPQEPQTTPGKEAKPILTPGTDPTNPVTQESTGDWIAGEKAAERRNNEPGLTDGERQHRKW